MIKKIDIDFLERRAKKAQEIFYFVSNWKPPNVQDDITPETMKRSIFQFQDKELLQFLAQNNLIKVSELDQILSAQKYIQSIKDYVESKYIFPNIYDLLLNFIFRWDPPFNLIYRGHYDSKWRLIPSFYRKGRIKDWLTERKQLISSTKKEYNLPDFDSLTTLQQDAILQHYKSGTKLLDFTLSVIVAAYFATRKQFNVENNPMMGTIYRVGPNDLESLGIGTVSAPTLPKGYLRIHNQKGVFIEIKYLSILSKPGLFTRWDFYHTSRDKDFECPAYKVTTDDLLPKVILKCPSKATFKKKRIQQFHRKLAVAKKTTTAPDPTSTDKIITYQGTDLISGEAAVLIELEQQIGKPIPKTTDLKSIHVGFTAENKHVTELKLYNQKLKSLPASFGNLKNLQAIVLILNQLSTFPKSFEQLENLQILSLMRNQLESLPETVGELKNLTFLDLNENRLRSLPESFSNLQKLKTLYLNWNNLSALPNTFGNLESLESLWLIGNKLSSLPKTFRQLKNLRKIYTDNRQLELQVKRLLPRCRIM